MARVHLFSSLSSTPHSRHSPSPEYDTIAEDPPLLSKDSNNESHNITISVTPQEERLQVESSPASPATKNIEPQQKDASSETAEQEKTALTNELTSSSAALTAALLQNAHGNNDMVGAVAAALSSVKPESFQTMIKEQQEQTDQSSRDKPEEVMDQAAAATALQLLGLSHSNDEDKGKDKKVQPQADNTTDSNVMLIADYSGLTSNLEDIDLSSEDLMQDYKRGTWTREEDELLLSGIKKFGYGRWKEIATAIPGRKGKQLKQRWDNTLAAKYVDQEWLRNKIRTEEELHHQQQQQQQQQQQASSSSSAMDTDKSTSSTDDKALKFLESTDWNDIALKISEKAREGDQHAIEALLSQALLGTVAHHTATAATTAATSATTTNNHSTASSPIQNHDTIIQHPSAPQDSSPSTPSATASNTNDALGLNFTRSPIDPNHHPPPLNYADATALALYATQLSHHNNNNNNNSNNNASNSLHLAGNQPFFNPFGINTSDHQAVAEAAAAAAAAVAAVAAQQQQRNNSNYPSGTSSPMSSSVGATTSKSIPVVGQKRRRSDPALADTQSAAMTIYASATPITTTINNQTQTVYPCLFPNCGKTFARLYNLKSHSRTHTDDRPFVCHACSAAFSRNHDLKRHSKIHGGDKPYKCEGCKKSFSRLDALKRHKSNQRNKQGCTED